jgi:hypothetical protein
VFKGSAGVAFARRDGAIEEQPSVRKHHDPFIFSSERNHNPRNRKREWILLKAQRGMGPTQKHEKINEKQYDRRARRRIA